MYRLGTNAKRDVVTLTCSGHVSLDEAKRCCAEVVALLPSIERGFRALTDFSTLEEMDAACAHEIGVTMDAIRNHGVSRIVRVLPDRGKDIGFTLMSIFHYRDVSVHTVETLAEAITAIES